MSKSFLTSVVGGRISVPTNLPEGTQVVVRIDGAKSVAQNARWRKVVKVVCEHLNRQDEANGVTAPPRHESEVHFALKRAFLGIEDDALTVRSIRAVTKAELSEALSRVEAYYSGLGCDFHHDERNYP